MNFIPSRCSSVNALVFLIRSVVWMKKYKVQRPTLQLASSIQKFCT